MAITKHGDFTKIMQREQKALDFLDYCLGEQCKKDDLKKWASEFILKRVHPEKTILAGDKDNPIPVVAYLPEVNGKIGK